MVHDCTGFQNYWQKLNGDTRFSIILYHQICLIKVKSIFFYVSVLWAYFGIQVVKAQCIASKMRKAYTLADE